MNINKIKGLAKVRKISLKELASRIGVSETGLHQSFAANSLRVDVLERISEVLEVPPSYFFESDYATIPDAKKEYASVREAGPIYGSTLPKQDTSDVSLRELRNVIAIRDKYIKVLEEQIDDKKQIINFLKQGDTEKEEEETSDK